MNIPPPEELLGSLITRSTRAFLVGPTGLGKTMLGAGMASGQGFLHWHSSRPCRILVFDGEMPGDLLIERLRDALRRAGLSEPPGGLFFYSLDLAETMAREYRPLGGIAPLCTDAGQRFVMALAEALKPDAIIFDNLMALLGTAALDPDQWEATLPLVAALSANRIGQLWIDHTNKDGMQYGTGTKPWRFDTVGVMLPLPATDRRGDDLAFTLSFVEPGKARRRTPANRSDYDRVVIRLRDDRWTSEPAPEEDAAEAQRPAEPTGKLAEYLKCLRSALATHYVRYGETNREAWLAECVRTGLVDPPPEGEEESATARNRREAPFRSALRRLRETGCIEVEEDLVRDPSQPRPREPQT
jgi:hypothetical protein